MTNAPWLIREDRPGPQDVRASARGRWECPGQHCGSYQGYKYGCREPECEASVAPHQAARRAAAGARPRTPVDESARKTIIDAVRAGRSLREVCDTVGVSPFRLGNVRRNDPDFDADLIQAASEGGLQPPLRPVRQLRCPGDCGTVGYRYGCRRDLCGQAHSALLSTSPSRQYPTRARRFGPADAEAVLAELRDGWQIVVAAARAGWSYDALSNARKNDAAFDAAVIETRAEARGRGEPGDHPRAVSRIRREES